MYLVMKHFPMDDVPVLLTRSEVKAEIKLAEINAFVESGELYATEDEQNLIGIDIDSSCISVSIVQFRNGLPVVRKEV